MQIILAFAQNVVERLIYDFLQQLVHFRNCGCNPQLRKQLNTKHIIPVLFS